MSIQAPLVYAPTILDELDEYRTALLRVGYHDVPQINGLRVGSRVFHSGQIYARGSHSTATVLAVLEHHPSDREFIILRDEPLLERMSPVTQWADYHTCPGWPYADADADEPSIYFKPLRT